MENHAGGASFSYNSYPDSPMFNSQGLCGFNWLDYNTTDATLQDSSYPAGGDSTSAAGMEIPQQLEVNGDLTQPAGPYDGHWAFTGVGNALQELAPPPRAVNAGFTQQAPYPAGDGAGPSATTGVQMEMEIPISESAAAEFDSLLETNNAGLTQPDQNSAHDIGFSTASDQEIIDHVRACWERSKAKESKGRSNNPAPEGNGAAISKLDPWEMYTVIDKMALLHFRHYYATSMWGSDEKTRHGGYWKEEDNNELEVIFNDVCRISRHGTRYIGLKRGLEFHESDGTKTHWRMREYIHLRDTDGHLFLQDGLVLRVVYRIPVLNINGEPDNELNMNNTGQSDCLHHDDTAQNNNQPPSGKRPRNDDHTKIRESDVWQHFTRIYRKVPKEDGPKKKKDCKKSVDGSKRKEDSKKYVYVVCHYCDKVFSADSKQGTSHHKRHAEACQCKHLQRNSN